MGVKDYWKSVVLSILLLVMLYMGGGALYLFVVLWVLHMYAVTGVLSTVPLLLLMIVSFVFGIGLQIRRLHDLGYSGWIVAVLFIASAAASFFGKTGGAGTAAYAPWAWLVIIVVAFIELAISLWPGNPAPNAYGASVVYRSWWDALEGKK